MRIGFALPQFGVLARQGDQVARFARQAEELGADSLWVGDRLLAPVDPVVGYGGGTTIPEVFRAILDPFTLLAVAATATRRARLGTNVLNAPWYPPAMLARALTSIDVISGGRLVVGLGIGWSPDEYAAAGIPMRARGARLDECLDALELLWTTTPARYQGTYWSVPATYAELKPVQSPRPPVYLAGMTPAAQRRVARRGDGWLPVIRPGAAPFDPAAITGPLGRIRAMAGELGRDPAAIGAVLRVYPVAGATAGETADALVRAGREAGIEDAFVDLMMIAGDINDAISLAGQILDRAR
jgi:probable F420-dependent oxidoreductase